MSMIRLKVAFLAAQRAASSRGAELHWDDYHAALIAEAPGVTLHTSIPYALPKNEQFQYELFDARRAEGCSIREIASAAKCSKDKVFRYLSQARTSSATAA